MSKQQRDPADQETRTFITTEIEESIFVAAAAGSGKTHSMIDRILKLIDSGKDVDSIAAVTFTERAASELRDRIRRSLHDNKNKTDVSQEVRDRRSAALDKIDGAMIGTLHGFAYRLLAENPIEAGLPVVFTVRDEASAAAARDYEWEYRLSELLEDAEVVRHLRLLEADGARRDLFKEIGEKLDDQWDLVPEIFKGQPEFDHIELLQRLVAEAQKLLDGCTRCSDECDLAYVGIGENAGAFIEAAGRVQSFEEALDLLGGPVAKLNIRGGKKGNWSISPQAVRDEVKDVTASCEAARYQLLEHSARCVITAIAKSVELAAENRKKVGEVTFDDLLVLTRQLLHRHPEVRRRLHERYNHILIDEFQDTDPLQLSIILLIASDPDAEGDHNDLVPLAGGVFLVGDPQQSIYRFRGADLKLYLEVQERVAGEDEFASAANLSVNFRSVGAVIDWVNDAFEKVIKARPRSQPKYSPLEAHRLEVLETGPGVAVLGGVYEDMKIDEIRVFEFEEIAATIVDAVGNWDVVEEATGEIRKACLGDIALLSWSRGRYPGVMDALERAGIPFRAESASLTYASQEVRALLHTLRAIDDPSDDFALVLALRSPLFGCGDDDLLSAKQALGSKPLKIGRSAESIPKENPVRGALDYLADLRQNASTSSPSELLERLANDRRLFELAQESSRPRDLWRRLRSVIDQAREWTASTGGPLADYLDWAAWNVEDGKRAKEAILPETDDDAVQLQTIHAVKGLEFPIVILFDLNSGGSNNRDPSIEIDGRDWEFYLNGSVQSQGMRDGNDERKLRELDELKRLLYVACTRARDHLVVCTHRRSTNVDENVGPTLPAEILAAASSGDLVKEIALLRGKPFPGKQAARGARALMPMDEWSERFERIREDSKLPEAISVTGLIYEEPATVRAPISVPVVETAEITVEAGPADVGARRLIGGTSFGSAVHAVLEAVDFSAPEALGVLSERAAASEGIESAKAAVQAVAASALKSAVLARASSATRVHRELFLAREVDGRVVEGVVDLLFEEPDGRLVVVDYKTDDVGTEQFEQKAGGDYAAQLAEYARLVKHVTGREVDEAWLLHLSEAGVRELKVSV